MADDLHLVTFRVGTELFGVPIAAVQEIVRVPVITRIPQSPAFVEGVINLRGHVIPVVDMRQRLNQVQLDGAAERDKRSRILVTEATGRLVGIIVDEVSEVLKLTAEMIEPAPQMVAGISNQYLRGVGKLQSSLIILVDIEKILSAEESAALGAVRAEETPLLLPSPEAAVAA